MVPVVPVQRDSPMLEKLIRRIRESGLLYTMQLVLNDFVPARYWRYQKVVVMEAAPANLPAGAATANTVRWGGKKDTDLLVRSGYSVSDLESRFDDGGRCVVMTENGSLVGISWYFPPSRALYEYNWIGLDLPDDSVWFYDLWITPRRRGQGIAGQIVAFAHRGLGEAGVRRVYCTIDKLNRNSLSAMERAGYERVGEFLIFRLLGVTALRCAGRWDIGRWRGDRRFMLSLSRLSGSRHGSA